MFCLSCAENQKHWWFFVFSWRAKRNYNDDNAFITPGSPKVQDIAIVKLWHITGNNFFLVLLMRQKQFYLHFLVPWVIIQTVVTINHRYLISSSPKATRKIKKENIHVFYAIQKVKWFILWSLRFPYEYNTQNIIVPTHDINALNCIVYCRVSVRDNIEML